MKEVVNNHPYHSTKNAVKREKKKIKQKNGPQKKLGFRDILTKSSRLCQYLYSSVRRGRQEGRKTERPSLEGREAGVN